MIELVFLNTGKPVIDGVGLPITGLPVYEKRNKDVD